MALKGSVLQFLEENRGKPVSGERLAQEFAVSRAAIWKVMKALQANGHHITALPKQGYLLELDSDLLTEQGIRCHLSPWSANCLIRIEEELESTNQLAKKLAADGAESGTVLLAEAQKKGRGRRGRSFYSPARTGLYMSIILRPQAESKQLPLITLAAAAAVCESIEALSPIVPEIKWVNDIFVGGKKVCGILTEAVSDFESGMTECVIVGIGINVRQPESGFPPELQQIAGALSDVVISRNELAAGIITRLLPYAEQISERAFMPSYRKHLMVLGKPIQYHHDDQWIPGKAVALDDNGGLILETAEGQVTLQAGEIKMGRG